MEPDAKGGEGEMLRIMGKVLIGTVALAFAGTPTVGGSRC